MRLHRRARLVQRIAGVVHVRFFHLAPAKCSRSEENMRKRLSNYGASARFSATLGMVSAT